MRLDQGGHLTHGSPVNFSGRLYRFVAYGVDDERETLDYDEIAASPASTDRRMIVAGATAYPRVIDFEAFRAIADEVDALLVVDAAHIAGLVAGGAHPSPVPVGRRRDLHDAQDAARPACGSDRLSRAVRDRDRQGRVPRAPGWPTDARRRGEGSGLPSGRPARLPRRTRPSVVDNARALAAALASEGFPHRLGWHRQPPDARRPPAVRRHREGRPGGARRRGDHEQQERDPQRSREAVRHERTAPGHGGRARPPAWASPRWRRSRRSSRACSGRSTTTRSRRRSRRPQPGSARSSRRTPTCEARGAEAERRRSPSERTPAGRVSRPQ